MQTVTTIGLDIAKSVFQVHGVDAAGQVVVRRRLKRRYVLRFFQRLPACLVGIEACASSHYWSRELQAVGHTVRLMPPAYVKPYIKRQKNDVTDAEAICEAVTRPSMRFVETKTPEQQSCLMLHRTRHLFIRQQTAVINAIRAHLAEFGIVAPVGRNGVEELLGVVADPSDKRGSTRTLSKASVERHSPSLTRCGHRPDQNLAAQQKSHSTCDVLSSFGQTVPGQSAAVVIGAAARVHVAANISVPGNVSGHRLNSTFVRSMFHMNIRCGSFSLPVPPPRTARQDQAFLMPRSVSLSCLRATDLAREPARHRSVSSRAILQALPSGFPQHGCPQHLGERQRRARLAHLRRLRPTPHRHRAAALCRRSTGA